MNKYMTTISILFTLSSLACGAKNSVIEISNICYAKLTPNELDILENTKKMVISFDEPLVPRDLSNDTIESAQVNEGFAGCVVLSFDLLPNGKVANVQVVHDHTPSGKFTKSSIMTLKKKFKFRQPTEKRSGLVCITYKID